MNIGCVFYQRGKEPGTLTGTWCHPLSAKGTCGIGFATGGPIEGFAGTYQIEYFDAQGTKVGNFELIIEKEGEYFTLQWFKNGELTHCGTGMEVSDGLAAGWRRLSDEIR